MTRKTLHVPGATGDEPAPQTVEELQAALDAANAKLAAQAAVVVAPVTPHGSAALAASATGTMTVDEVMAAIDAGQLREPITSYLCADGYYTRRTAAL